MTWNKPLRNYLSRRARFYASGFAIAWILLNAINRAIGHPISDFWYLWYMAIVTFTVGLFFDPTFLRLWKSRKR